ncbi:MAG: KEOPS complex subunit Cgi121 [Candidatus Thorarchaeota archaeon]|jgi:tRNA threonylcarbamoyladenosine modification (KEOPS) complex Cgi121 subunit
MLDSNEVPRVVGVSEIQNSNRLTQEELLALATSMSNESLNIQLINGLLVIDETHLLSAAQNALNAQNGGYMLSRSLEVEIIVYASAQRQIGRALEDMGIYNNLKHIAVVMIGADKESVEQSMEELVRKVGTEFTDPFEASKERFDRISEHFEIDEKEIATFTESDDILERTTALSRCVVSRVSLVAFDS